MNIGKFDLGNSRVFVIAEIGNNHNGSLDLAVSMIDSAINAGADCVKFQMRDMPSVYRKKSLQKQAEDLGTEYVLDLLSRFQLTIDEHRKLFDYCNRKNIVYMCTPWDSNSIEVLESFGVAGYKVASTDLTNLPLIVDLIAASGPYCLRV